MAKIFKVDKGSIAEKLNIKVGDNLTHINGKKVLDVLDYKFYIYDEVLTLTLETDTGTRTLNIKKEEGEDLGVDFETYLMDKAKSCSNKCIFCFIDQLPKNLRQTLYFKDDDARLSFLMGNYISLTNLSKNDVERVVRMRISPVNISVQTTNPQLRCLMLGNKKAGESLEIMNIFAENHIEMNTQLVICHGVNDGEELTKSLYDLKAMYPSVNSISVVPAGITKYRDGLYPLEQITLENARDIIKRTETFALECIEEFGTSLAFCSDELYQKADLPLPSADYYEEFVQFENGIGMLSLFEEEFYLALDDYKNKKASDFTIATGVAATKMITKLVDEVKKICHNLSGDVYTIKNDFFGDGVNVAGLITGGDLIKSLKGKKLASRILISENMLKDGEGIFLDDYTVEEVEKELGAKLVPVEIDGEGFLKAIFS